MCISGWGEGRERGDDVSARRRREKFWANDVNARRTRRKKNWAKAVTPPLDLETPAGASRRRSSATMGPPPQRPEAKPFLRRALNTYFEAGPEKWNFERFRGIVWAGGRGSKVIDRQQK